MKYLLLHILFLFSSSLCASELKDIINARILPIVKTVDGNANTTLELKSKNQRVQKNIGLIGTPFLFTDENQGSLSLPQLASIELNIITRLENYPKDIENLIRKTLNDYSENVSIVYTSVNSLPQEVSSSPKLTSMRDVIMFGSVLFLIVAYVLINKRSTRSMIKSLSSEIGGLASAFKGVQSESVMASHQPASGTQNMNEVNINTSKSSVWEDFNTDSLVAILSDCYWCKMDTYAAYIWKKLKIHQRSDIFAKLPCMLDYSNYINQLSGEDFEYENDPYYIYPIEIKRTSNEDLEKSIEQNNFLIHSISIMRRKHLELEAKTKIEFLKSQKQPHEKIQRISFPVSLERLLKSKEYVFFKTTEEEHEYITSFGDNLENTHLEDMEKVPSLAWLLRAEKSFVETLLSQFSAKDLASIWIGPQEVLNELLCYMPQKKQELLLSYREQVFPSRENDLFVSIHENIIEHLESYLVLPYEEQGAA